MLTTQRHDRQARFLLESLDDRLVLSAGAAAGAVVHHPVANHAHHKLRPEVLGHEARALLPANVSAALRSLYREYKDQGGGSHFAPALSGTRVAVLIKVDFPPAFDAVLRQLRADGLRVIRTSAAYGLVRGTLPIAALPAAAQDSAHIWLAPRRIM